MVESIVRQVEDANDALRRRETQLEKENLHVTAQLKVSQMAVADMIRRYKLLENSLEEAKKEIRDMKQAGKPRERVRKMVTKKIRRVWAGAPLHVSTNCTWTSWAASQLRAWTQFFLERKLQEQVCAKYAGVSLNEQGDSTFSHNHFPQSMDANTESGTLPKLLSATEEETSTKKTLLRPTFASLFLDRMKTRVHWLIEPRCRLNCDLLQ